MYLLSKKQHILFCLLLLCSFLSKAQLVINEVSQGPSGSKEYVELVVVGTPTCTTIPCLDLRGYILDDNNGSFSASPTGAGVASGCMRLSNDALWSCVPIGTIIVIYNDDPANTNPSIPAIDISLTDGNCRLIVPAGNCTLMEKNTSSPNTGSSSYPTVFTACGDWNTVGLANSSGDSFQVRDASGALVSALSYNNNNVSTIVYLSSMLTGKVGSNLNTVDNNPFNSANWASANVAGNETPGAPNNAANAAWINAMNFSCGSPTPTVSFINTGCTCTGSATVTIPTSGATAPYTYSWLPSGGTNATASNLCAGNYTVTINSANSCVLTATTNIAQTNSVTASATSTSVNCNGGSNGSATVTVFNGTSPITYTWSPGGGNNVTASNLTAGNYSVTITDANSCTVTATTTINQPSTLSVSISSTNVSCNGGSNGTATVTTSGGTGPYTYTWSPSGGNNSSANNLAQGTYTIHILDANLCIKDTQVVITEPPVLTLSLTSTGEACGQKNGTASATASGGTGTLQYSWSPSGGNSSLASNLQTGTYTLTVTDALSCSLSGTVSVQEFLPPVLSVTSTSVLCNAGNTGAATSTITSGGTPAYTYTWSPSGGNNSSANNLTIGNYTLVVTDAKGCKDTAYTTIAEPPAVTATLTSTPATCGNNNGTITSNVTGGVTPYTYTWSPSGGNNSTANNLASGNYTLNVSDANACTFSASINVANKPAPILSVSSTSVTCFGANTGSATVAINAGTGTAPFTYTWSPNGGNNATASNLLAGDYTVVVSDSASCTATITVSVTQPAAPLSTTITSTASLCNQANGTTSVTVNGGTPGYTYTWTPVGGNNATATNLIGNVTYTVNITDANACAISTQTLVTQNSTISLTVTSTPATCGNTNGTASVTATGGAPAQTGYTYTWTPTGGNNSTANSLIGNATYTISVEDSLQCIASKTITIGNKPSPILSVTSTTNVTCFGLNNGGATVSVNAGTGTLPFIYAWLPSGGNNASATNLSAGNYTVVVSDSANCMDTVSITINQPPALTVTATSTLATCGNANGAATCNVSGGMPGYTYTWTPSGGNNSSATNLAGNITYTCTITDANLCTATTSTLVNQTPPLTMTVASTQSVTCNNGSNGSISVNSSGSAATTYTWMPSGGNALTASNLTASILGTTYTLIGNDGGCKDSVTATLIEPPALIVTVNNQISCGGVPVVLTTTVNGGNNTALSYTWSPTGTSTISTATVNPATTSVYTVYVQNTGCAQITQATSTVTVFPPLTITVTPSYSVCSGQPATLTATASGGGGGTNTYHWSTGASTSSINVSPVNSTTYTVTSQNTNCATIATATTQVIIYTNPTLGILATPVSGCAFVCVSFTATANNIVGNSVTSYTWDFGDGNSYSAPSTGHCYYHAGNYNVTLNATTQNNCIETITKPSLVHVHANPVADFSASTFTTNIDDGTIQFYNQSSGGVTNWNWQIDTTTSSIQNPSHSFYDEGTYPITLIVIDSAGCTDTITKHIVITPEFAFYAPNCITPNNDGRNEVFLPEGTGWNNTTFDLWIFDRWGNAVAHTTDPSQGWNGTKHNELVQEDTYVWKVELVDIFGKTHQFNGIVSVVR